MRRIVSGETLALNESRKQFEEWVSSIGHSTRRDLKGHYDLAYTATAWIAWQASRAPGNKVKE